MTQSRTIVSLVAALTLAGALATGCGNATRERAVGRAADTTVGYQAVRDSVGTVLNAFAERMSSRDFAGAGELYSSSPAFYWIEAGELRYRSVAEVRAALLTLRTIPEIKLRYYETRIDVLSSTVATVRTEFAQTFVPAAGRSTTYGGYLTITMTRDAEGWRMRNGHTSSRRPRPDE